MQPSLGSFDARRKIRRYVSWLLPSLLSLIALATITSWLPEPFPDQRGRRAQAVLLEHRSLCEKFGLDPLSTRFAECLTDLMELRSRDGREAMFF